jgi:hypothetical protein
VFGSGNGILGFYLDEDAQLIRIFDILWIGWEERWCWGGLR